MTPEDWRDRLVVDLHRRQRDIERFDAYYRGDHPLEFATREFLEAFGGLFGAFADNWCETVVNAVNERLKITGFRVGQSADTAAWDIWKRNRMLTESSIAHVETLVCAVSYLLVWPVDGRARITVEHASQMITASKVGDRRTVAAAWKTYQDDDGSRVGWLYLPGEVRRYRSKSSSAHALVSVLNNPGSWELDTDNDVDGPAVVDNPFGDVVPAIPLENRPRLIAQPRSEIENVIPLQDAVNKEWADLMVASEFTADTQRWILGYEPEIDPETNQPLNPPDRRKRIWTLEQNEAGEHPVTIGQFKPGELTGYTSVIETLVQHIASQTRTPPHYLNPGADRLSGESIEASESGLISKVLERQAIYSEAWADAIRLSFIAEGDAGKAEETIETLWAPPVLRSDAQKVDAAVKLQQLGVPWGEVMAFLGYEPSAIARMQAQRLIEAQLTAPPAPERVAAVAEPAPEAPVA